MNHEMEPPEKKRRKKTTTTKKKSSSPPPPPQHPSFSSLPVEITVSCLARIPRSYYPRLSIVSRSFRSILSSKDLYVARSQLGISQQCFYVCLWDPGNNPQWFTLWINPNRTNKTKRKKTIGQLFVPIPSSGCPLASKATVAIGSEIYVIGGPVEEAPSSSRVRILDCRSHTWRDAPSMNVARTDASTCFYDGKIYVMGGVKDKESSYAEVFDIEAQTWECLPDPGAEIRKCWISKFTEVEGTINFGHVNKMYAYDIKQGKWKCCVNKRRACRRSECVMGNVVYSGWNLLDFHEFTWRDINGGDISEVKGLDALREIYMRNGGYSYNTIKLASCDGKLLLIWEGYKLLNPGNRKKIWGAEISIEKRDGGEIWGNVEWVDVVHTVPVSCELLHCIAVSL